MFSKRNEKNSDVTIHLPGFCKTVDDVNCFIEALSVDKQQHLSQESITYIYNRWTPEEQKRFIWPDGIKPSFNSTPSLT